MIRLFSVTLLALAFVGCKPSEPSGKQNTKTETQPEKTPVPAKKKALSRTEFELIVLNEMKDKSAKDFIDRFGKPDKTQDYEPISAKPVPEKFLEFTYKGLTFDPISEKIDFNVVIRFDGISLESKYLKHTINP